MSDGADMDARVQALAQQMETDAAGEADFLVQIGDLPPGAALEAVILAMKRATIALESRRKR